MGAFISHAPVAFYKQNTYPFEIMIDLETLDVPGDPKAKPIILSIGAYKFQTPEYSTQVYESMLSNAYLESLMEKIPSGGEIGYAYQTELFFYSPVSLKQSMSDGFTYSKGTVDFWMKQENDLFAAAANTEYKTKQTLQNLWAWIQTVKPAHVWCNPPRFDASILLNYFHTYDIPVWDHYSERCVRTFLKEEESIQYSTDHSNLLANYTRRDRTPCVKHNALHDAVFQAAMVNTARIQRGHFLTQLNALQGEKEKQQ